MTFYLIPLGLLLVSVVIARLFMRRKQPVLGFALGVVPILVFWLYLVLRAEWSLYLCRNDVTYRCELTGVGILVVTAFALALITFSAVAVALMDLGRLYSQWGNLFGPANRSEYPWPAWLLLLGIIVLTVFGLVAGYWLAGVIGGSTAIWVTPFLAMVMATAGMVLQERRAAQE